MAQIEEILLPETINDVFKIEPYDFDYEGAKPLQDIERERYGNKMGEIYRSQNELWHFVCVHCSNEFSQFSQFSLHAEEHLSQFVPASLDSKSELVEEDEGTRLEEEMKLSDINFNPGIDKNEALECVDEASELPMDTKESHTRINKKNVRGEFSCPECNNVFSSHSSAKQHMNKYHRGKKFYRCEECQLEFGTKREINAHNGEHHIEKIRNGSVSRKDQEIGAKLFGCPECGRRYTRHLTLKHHIKEFHKKDPYYRCDDCEAEFSILRDLNTHTQNVHGKKIRTIPSRNTSKNEEAETPKKLYSCTKCDKKFLSPWSMRLHLKLHFAAKPFTCKICIVKFATGESLLNHFKVAHNLKETFYNCKMKEDFNDDEHHFKCPFCEKTIRKLIRSHHLQSHTNDRLFQCYVCGKTFSTGPGLAKHKLYHLEKLRYKCDLCPKGFTLSNQLKVHKRTHTGELVYNCKECEKRFTENRTLKRHMLSVHGRELEGSGLCYSQMEEGQSSSSAT